jgi:hypothetical protein
VGAAEVAGDDLVQAVLKQALAALGVWHQTVHKIIMAYQMTS